MKLIVRGTLQDTSTLLAAESRQLRYLFVVDDVRTERCRLEVDSGQCDETILAWYFDEHAERCESFTWSGCGGNDNRFETEEECMSQCMWITAEGE